MTDWDDLIAQVDRQDPHRASVRVLIQTEPFLRLRALRAQLEGLVEGKADVDVTEEGPQDIIAEIAELAEQYDETEFVFESISGPAYDDLQWAHPADDPRRGVADTFWPALMAACAVDGPNEKQFAQLQAKLNPHQWRLIKGAVIEVCEAGTDLRPLRAATAMTNGGGKTSTTAPSEASPSQRSVPDEDVTEPSG